MFTEKGQRTMILQKINEFSGKVEFIAGQTLYYEIEVSNDRKIFVISDFDTSTQDNALQVWFSKKPFELNIRYKNYENRNNVQQNKPLQVSIVDINLNDTVDPKLDALTVEVPAGKYYINIQNMTGGSKSANLILQ